MVMELKRRVFAAGGTLLMAAAAGHLVQNADVYFSPKHRNTAMMTASAPGFGVREVTTLSAPADTTETTSIVLPSAPVILAKAQDFGTATKALATRMEALDASYAPLHTDDADYNEFGLACEVALNATTAPAAMVSLALKAPCHSDQKVTIQMGSLRFSMRTDGMGALSVQVPALSTAVDIAMKFEDGSRTGTHVAVPEASEFDRVALQWQGNDAMHLHAYEFGAGFKDAGHVWAGAARAPSDTVTERGGFLTALGDTGLAQPQLAEVYSFPRGLDRASGSVRLNVETEVTAANCGRMIAAETLQPLGQGRYQPAEITLAIPDCDATGEFLVLKNILRDLKIAHN